MQRVELAWHTGYSRMDGIGLGDDIVKFAVQNNINTLVITDTGNVDGYTDFQQYIKWKGINIKLIMGADLYIYDDRDVAGKVVTSGRLSVLIRNEIGKKNLYKILSEGERKYKNDYDEPQIPLSLLLNNREGLLIGSGSENGLIVKSYDLCVNSENTLGGFAVCEFDRDIYWFLDYIEIPAYDISSTATDELLELAGYYRIPAVAVCAPHYMRPDEGKAYAILKDITWDDCKYYRDTEDMLDAFAFLGEEKAFEIVVTNSNRIADMCEEVLAIPDKKMHPIIENQDEILKDVCEKSLPEKYEEITNELIARLDWELNAIKSSKSAFIFIQIKDVIDRLGLQSFEFGSRGLVGSSLVAYLCGISEIDPVKANLSPYFFYGFNGDREPDIDLNFRSDIQKAVHEAFADAPGVGTVVKAGTFGTISERYADSLIVSYGDENNRYLWGTNRYDTIDSLTKCVKSRGQHPGGIIIMPKGIEVTDIFPLASVKSCEEYVETSAFDYHSIDFTTYKFDALSHDSPEIIKRLYDITGADPGKISLDDPKVMEMFKIKDDKLPGCAGIPEFSSEYVFNAMKIADCKSFDDLVKLCGLMHGTDVWLGNAEELIKNGTASISEVLADRNDVYDALIAYDIDEETAFKIAEDVRKGKISKGRSGKWEEWKLILRDHNVPDWFIWSCERIRYMFPRAHSYSYMLAAWRMAWYKIHYPLEFYKVMLEVQHKDGFDVKYMAYGKERLGDFTELIRSDYAATATHVMNARKTCMLLHDYYDHGFTFTISEKEALCDEMFHIVDEYTIEVDGSR